MIVTEAWLRERVRRPEPGAVVVLPPGSRLSPAAADFVAHWRLEVREGPPDGPGGHTPAPGPAPAWDRPASFPVVRREHAPRCTACGQEVSDKPSGLTELNACHYAAKTHPRIVLRGRLDSLHALMLLAQGVAGGEYAETAAALASLAAYCRELIGAEFAERPAAELTLDGYDAETVHRATHDPDGVLGVPHLTLAGDAPPVQLWLNLVRTQCRETEIAALQAFGNPHEPSGASICAALNRLSSAVYYLQLRLQPGAHAPMTGGEGR